MRTLFLNPPSFEGFDGGAGSRWPASREIESYWYPVWLAYPAGLLEDSKLVDAPPHKIGIDDFTVGQHTGWIAQPDRIPIGFDFAGGGPSRTGATVETFE